MSRQRISWNESSWADVAMEPATAMVAARARFSSARMRASMPRGLFVGPADLEIGDGSRAADFLVPVRHARRNKDHVAFRDRTAGAAVNRCGAAAGRTYQRSADHQRARAIDDVMEFGEARMRGRPGGLRA